MSVREKFYDGKRLFEAWRDMGRAATMNRLRDWAQENMPNPLTGKVSLPGPYYAMWSWAFRNPTESYEIWKAWKFNVNPAETPPVFQEYLLELRRRAAGNPSFASRVKLEEFCEKWNLPASPRPRKRSRTPGFALTEGAVIQIVNPGNFLCGRLLKVSGIDKETGFVQAKMVDSDGSSSDHYIKPEDVAVIGPAFL